MTSYREIRPEIQPGDMFAFGGRGIVSNLIKSVCWPVSHVGFVVASRLTDRQGGDPQDGTVLLLAESTTLRRGDPGVRLSRLSAAVADYAEGGSDIWWLGLGSSVRDRLDLVEFNSWMLRQEGVGYDYRQAIASGIDIPSDLRWLSWLARWTWTRADFSRLFCSEYGAAGYQAGGGLPHTVNPSEVTPLNMCQIAIWGQIIQIAGRAKRIPGANAFPIGVLARQS